MLKAGLVGVTGYTGMELARILAGHPSMRLVMATSRQEAGRRLDELYPFLRGLRGGNIVVREAKAAELAEACDVVFLAVPHGYAMNLAVELYKAGTKVVDLSADFRLHDPALYEQWYGIRHTHTDYLTKAVYGLPELHAEDIARTRLAANPGSYATASILGLHAALRHNLVCTDDIIIDAKGGVSLLGRKKATRDAMFCEAGDNVTPYNFGSHRHTAEIEQEVAQAAHIGADDLHISLTPHLVPMSRGILATIYTRLKTPRSQQEVQMIFDAAWAGSRWVRVLPAGKMPEPRSVRGSMFCEISVTVDSRCNRLIITSTIDNLCRGGAGQAIANANLMCYLPMEEGLDIAPMMM